MAAAGEWLAVRVAVGCTEVVDDRQEGGTVAVTMCLPGTSPPSAVAAEEGQLGLLSAASDYCEQSAWLVIHRVPHQESG